MLMVRAETEDRGRKPAPLHWGNNNDTELSLNVKNKHLQFIAKNAFIIPTPIKGEFVKNLTNSDLIVVVSELKE